MRRGWALMVSVILLVPLLAAGTASSLTGNGIGTYDAFEAWTFNDVSATTQEIAYTGRTVVEYTSPQFDTSAFTLQSADGEDSPSGSLNLNGCVKAPDPPPGPNTVVLAGRTAWFRFNPGVAGVIDVLATTGYDSVLFVREARKATWGSTTFTDLRGRPFECADVAVGNGNEQVHFGAARADRAYYVQVGAKCPTDQASCASAAGGQTSIRLTFTPSDSDGDGVPDTLDQCPGQGAAGGVNAVGCTDRDGDQIADSEDDCPDQPGGVLPDPYNGCPPGPTPPDKGVARVTIVGLDGDPLNTKSNQVRLVLDWPQGTQEAFADNGIGDEPVRIDFARQPVSWTLPPTSKSESRGVNVRFRGPGINVTDDDEITLDAEAPTVPKAVVLPAFGGRYAVGINVSDGKDGSGVQSLTLLNAKRKAISKSVVCKKSCASFLDSLTPRARPAFVRVADRAGNVDVIRLGPALKGCKPLVLKKSPPTAKPKCFPIGSACTAALVEPWNLEGRNLACAGGVIVKTPKP